MHARKFSTPLKFQRSARPCLRASAQEASPPLPNGPDDVHTAQRAQSALLRELRLAAARTTQPSPGKAKDWRCVRAQLVAQEMAGSRAVTLQPLWAPDLLWAHRLATIEHGCLLISRQEDMDCFSGSVVLIAWHDATGSMGLVLNRRGPDLIRHARVDLELSEHFQNHNVGFGGPCNPRELWTLHSQDAIWESHEVLQDARLDSLQLADELIQKHPVQDVRLGGLQHANALVQKGHAQAADFHLLAGSSLWSPGQLEQEVAAGCWHAVTASMPVLRQCILGRLPSPPLGGSMWGQLQDLARIVPDSTIADDLNGI